MIVPERMVCWAVAARVRMMRAIVDGRCDARESRLIAGTPRSGTTWLAELLGTLPGALPIFEPLHLDRVPAARTAGFSWRTFVDPDEPAPACEAFLSLVLQGRVLNAWTLRNATLAAAARCRFVLAKFVRANRLLPWLVRRIPMRPPILLIRHPCAVVASQIREGSWSHPAPPELPPPLADVSEIRRIVDRLETREQILAAQWAIDYRIPCFSPERHRWELVVYEQLAQNPRGELQRILSLWSDVLPQSASVLASKPSSTTHASGISGLYGWTRRLSRGQIGRILDVVRAFDLHMYNDDPAYFGPLPDSAGSVHVGCERPAGLPRLQARCCGSPGSTVTDASRGRTEVRSALC